VGAVLAAALGEGEGEAAVGAGTLPDGVGDAEVHPTRSRSATSETRIRVIEGRYAVGVSLA
jgi:hypothetical protein